MIAGAVQNKRTDERVECLQQQIDELQRSGSVVLNGEKVPLVMLFEAGDPLKRLHDELFDRECAARRRRHPATPPHAPPAGDLAIANHNCCGTAGGAEAGVWPPQG